MGGGGGGGRCFFTCSTPSVVLWNRWGFRGGGGGIIACTCASAPVAVVHPAAS